jgi:tRNA pseudouridine55 synthase
MTKKLGRLLDSDKIYEGEMILGATSESFDTEREIQSVVKELNISEEEIKKGTRFFTGIIKQTPPVFSAVKYKGKPSYKYARKGINIERKERTVKISEFTILKIGLPSVFFRIACSKGTYIRSVVNDFGEKLGTGAYLKSLRRLSIGEYNIKNSVSLDNFLETGYALCTTGDKS